MYYCYVIKELLFLYYFFVKIEVEAGDLETPIQSPDPAVNPPDAAPGINGKDKPQPEQDISISELFNTKVTNYNYISIITFFLLCVKINRFFIEKYVYSN